MIKDYVCKDLTENQISDLLMIFDQAFDSHDCSKTLEHYLQVIENVLILYTDDHQPAAFLFYQQKMIAGYSVLQFSLSGKSGQVKKVQTKLGSYLFYKYVISFRGIFRLNSFVTISNNPRSYYNMLSLGGSSFPYVLNPDRKFKYASLYDDVAKAIGASDVDERGILKNRMQSLEFQIKDEQTDQTLMDSKGKAFMNYIDGDASHGVLVFVCGIPIIDLPLYYLKSIIKKFKKRLSKTGYHGDVQKKQG
jgi:hypothetical protein